MHEARKRQPSGAKATTNRVVRLENNGGQPALRGDDGCREPVGSRTDYRNVTGQWHGRNLLAPPGRATSVYRVAEVVPTIGGVLVVLVTPLP